MEKVVNKKLNKCQTIFVSIISAMAVLLFVIFKLGVSYETNDDRIINEIFSGTMTGIPDPHAIYINYLIGVFISSLYNITKAIPWYGIFLLLCYVLINSAVLTILLNKGKNIKEQVYIWFLGMLVILCNVYIFSVLQYTTISGALAVAGYVWLILDDRKKRAYSVFGLFELLSILLRRDSMLMVQPIGLCVVGGLLLTNLLQKNIKLKDMVAEGSKVFIALIAVITVFWIGNNVIGDYSSTEWKEYKKYNDLRTQLMDYYGYPEYEECKNILDEYNVSELEYHGVRCYFLLDNVLETECMEELVSIASTQYKNEHTFTARDVINKMTDYVQSEERFGYELAVPAMYIMISLLFVFCKKWKEIVPIVALYASRCMIFAYLIVRGRMPDRVANILFFAELLLLLAIFVKTYFGNEDMHKKHAYVKCICMLIFVVIMAKAIKRSYIVSENVNKLHKVYEIAMFSLFDYMEENGGGFIVCDDVTTYYSGTALTIKRYQGQNSLVSGGWFYNSPMMSEAISNYKEQYSDNMYCIVFKDVPGFDHGFVLTLLSELYDVNLKLEDTFYLEALGQSYGVYKLEGSIQ